MNPIVLKIKANPKIILKLIKIIINYVCIKNNFVHFFFSSDNKLFIIELYVSLHFDLKLLVSLFNSVFKF